MDKDKTEEHLPDEAKKMTTAAFLTDWGVWFVIVSVAMIWSYFADSQKGGYLDGYGKFMVGCIAPVTAVVGSFALNLFWLSFIAIIRRG